MLASFIYKANTIKTIPEPIDYARLGQLLPVLCLFVGWTNRRIKHQLRTIW